MEIRPATAEDAEEIRAIYAAIVETTAISFELEAPSTDEMASRITARHPTLPWLAAVEGSTVVGYAYAGRFSTRPAYDWSVETSIYVDGRRRRRGVGRALYEELLHGLAEQGYRQAMAGIALPNAASVALHEAVGFAPVGVYRAVGWKFGRWHDVGWWQRPLGPDEGPPSPVRPVRGTARGR